MKQKKRGLKLYSSTRHCLKGCFHVQNIFLLHLQFLIEGFLFPLAFIQNDHLKSKFSKRFCFVLMVDSLFVSGKKSRGRKTAFSNRRKTCRWVVQKLFSDNHSASYCQKRHKFSLLGTEWTNKTCKSQNTTSIFRLKKWRRSWHENGMVQCTHTFLFRLKFSW